MDITNRGMFDQDIIATSGGIKEQAEQEERKLEQRERVVQTQQDFIETYERQKADLEHITAAERAYFTQAWPDESRLFRQRENLPAHNINIFAPEIDNVVGLERQNRRDIRLMPVERDDENRAELLTLFLQHLARVNRDWHYELDMFRAGLIGGRAHQELYWDFSQDVFGELKTINRPPSEVLVDPDATDADTLSGDTVVRFHMEWLTPRQLERRYRQKQIDWSLLTYGDPNEEPPRARIRLGGIEDRYDYEYPADHYRQLFWKKDKQWIRLVRCWRRDIKTAYRLIDLSPELDDPEMAYVDDFDSQNDLNKGKLALALAGRDIRYMASQPVQMPYWSYHVMSGRAELEWQPDIGPYAPWIDYFAIALNGRVAGLWNRVQDRQQWVNFTMSKLSERMGRLGHMPIVVRENAFADDFNLATALRDGNPIVVRAEVWDRMGGNPPYHVIPDRSLESIAPLVALTQSMKDDAKVATGVGDVQRGLAPGSVTAASALAILQQEGSKILSGYSQNMQLARALKAQLRLYMLYQQYRKTPTLMRLKLERIFGSVLKTGKDKEIQKLMLEKMASGGVDLDSVIRSIRTMKYDVELTETTSSLLERQQVLQEIQLAASFGVQPDQETVIDILPTVPSRVKDRMREGVKARKAEMEQMAQSQAGQAQLASEMLGRKQQRNSAGQLSKESLGPVVPPVGGALPGPAANL